MKGETQGKKERLVEGEAFFVKEPQAGIHHFGVEQDVLVEDYLQQGFLHIEALKVYM